mmetsp:Transcript_9237/g.19469  ORF Transcript_9237/g.19469 Transcript_9237/m.19469 type:complete len:103 (+) Transcript_9237:150-458(+)
MAPPQPSSKCRLRRRKNTTVWYTLSSKQFSLNIIHEDDFGSSVVSSGEFNMESPEARDGSAVSARSRDFCDLATNMMSPIAKESVGRMMMKLETIPNSVHMS